MGCTQSTSAKQPSNDAAAVAAQQAGNNKNAGCAGGVASKSADAAGAVVGAGDVHHHHRHQQQQSARSRTAASSPPAAAATRSNERNKDEQNIAGAAAGGTTATTTSVTASSKKIAATTTPTPDTTTTTTTVVTEEEEERTTPSGDDACGGSGAATSSTPVAASNDDRTCGVLSFGSGGGANDKLHIAYGCMSRRGRDPDDCHKPNQDSFSIHTPFCQSKSDIFFGVYDGHGPTGQHCAQFVTRLLPKLVHDEIVNHDDFVLTADQIHRALRSAHVQCNEQLHDCDEVDDTRSGTTSISLYVQGKYNRITISNVGDSRAVLGTKTGTSSKKKTNTSSSLQQLRAIPLSNDHTPHRRDESERCRQQGARILSFGQISGIGDDGSDTEDPPRVWAASGKYPGTAFTRSIGDSIAEKLGVYGEPEMLTLKLSNQEKVIVLASDGVFDVMTNQQVIDMCYGYYHRKKKKKKEKSDDDAVCSDLTAAAAAMDACKAVIEKSHEEWLKNEDCLEEELASYDDMTIACIFIYDKEEEEEEDEEEVGNGVAAAAAEPSDTAAPTTTTADASRQQKHRKRVRQKTLRNLDELGE